MIVLHRNRKDSFADQIEETLTDLVVAHKTVIYNRSDPQPETPLPFLKENDTKVTGNENINAYLRELSNELQEQRSISGDACYIDPRTGEIC